jgi:hypothetical protein
MATPIIIGIAGPAGCGKDTVAAHLARQHEFEHESFAAPLRRMVQSLIFPAKCRWEDRAWKESPLPRLGLSPRRLLQTLGTEWGRSLQHDFWLRIAAERMAHLTAVALGNNEAPCVVWSDVRFENEAQWIRKQGGQVWHLRRAHARRVESHVSETGLLRPKNEVLIHNNGTPEQLFEVVDGLVEALFTDREAL